MATEPNLVNAVQNVSQAVTNSESWLKQHQTLVLAVLVSIIIFFGLQKVFDIWSKIEDHRSQEANTALQVQQAKVDAELAQAKELLNSYQQALLNSQVQNAQLANAIVARDRELTIQQKKDEQMSPSDLSMRWQGLVNDPGVQNTQTGFTVTPSAALTTVKTLEQVPVLQKNLADEQTKEANLQDTVNKSDALINQGKIVVDGLQVQLQAKDKACTAEINAVKADARKGKMKWFGVGFVMGYISGVATRIGL